MPHSHLRPRHPILARTALVFLLLAGPLGAATASETLPLSAIGRGLNAENRTQKSVGRLLWRGGLEISSSDARFGGLSGLLISPDGQTMTAITDHAHWLTARLNYDDMGNLSGIGDAQIGRLSGPTGAPLSRKKNLDSESLTRLADGSIWVGFERQNRILHYPSGPQGLANRPRPVPQLPAMRKLLTNDSLEALATLSDGRVLAISESPVEGGETNAFLWDGQAWAELRLARHGQFKPTGATVLPDGNLLVLERRFSALGGLAIRLRLVDAGEIAPGALLGGEEVAVFRPPLTYDNMEGIDVRRGRDGEILIYLVADDNFSLLQRTLLLMFELMP